VSLHLTGALEHVVAAYISFLALALSVRKERWPLTGLFFMSKSRHGGEVGMVALLPLLLIHASGGR
jgi:hypothetical protein